MIRPVADGSADLTIGTRWMPGGKIVNWPLTRQFISRAGTSYARIVLGIKLRDITSGFRVFRSEVLRSIIFDRIESKGYGFQIEMALETLENGFRVEEVPITFVERVDGVSKMNKAIVIEALWKVTIWGLQRLVKRR
jgi:dolichol-phosphate mannosyltransferase